MGAQEGPGNTLKPMGQGPGHADDQKPLANNFTFTGGQPAFCRHFAGCPPVFRFFLFSFFGAKTPHNRFARHGRPRNPSGAPGPPLAAGNNARLCPLCQSPGEPGSERHYLNSWPHTQEAREQAIRCVTHVLSYVGLPKWQTLPSADRMRFLCASCLPMRSQQSRVKRSLWMTKTVNIAAILATNIHSSLLSH